jgi:hypothetical protein
MPRIPIAGAKAAGLYVLVSRADAAAVLSHPFAWHLGTRYVQARTLSGASVSLHRFLMRPRSGQHIDHINRDTFDNRRVNLRATTQRKNNVNRTRGGSVGVRWSGVNGKWMAYARPGGKASTCQYIGAYVSEAEAVQRRAAFMRGEWKPTWHADYLAKPKRRNHRQTHAQAVLCHSP